MVLTNSHSYSKIFAKYEDQMLDIKHFVVIFTNYDFGFLLVCRLTKLQILELRENQLKMLPK